MIEIVLWSIPGWIIGVAGLVYMHKFDNPEEVEVIKEVEVIVYKERIIKVPLKTVTKHLVVYRDGKEPAEKIYVDRPRQFGIESASLAQQAAYNHLSLLGAHNQMQMRSAGMQDAGALSGLFGVRLL